MKTIAIVNEKGGTGKTTTAVNLAAALGAAGHTVLLVDLDGQAASSRWLGVEDDPRLADALLAGGGLEPIQNVIPGVSLAPGSGKLDSVAHDLRPTQGGQLRKVLADLPDRYEYALIDCPPSLGNRLIGNGLLAATHAIVPVEMSVLALDGLRILLTTLDDIRDGFDHPLELMGVVACRFEPRTRLSRLILAELQRALPGKVFGTVIRETVRMQECPASGQSILTYAPKSNAAQDYLALAEELASTPCDVETTAPGEHGDLTAEPDLSDSERLAVVDFRQQARDTLMRGSRESGWHSSSAPTDAVEAEGQPEAQAPPVDESGALADEVEVEQAERQAEVQPPTDESGAPVDEVEVPEVQPVDQSDVPANEVEQAQWQDDRDDAAAAGEDPREDAEASVGSVVEEVAEAVEVEPEADRPVVSHSAPRGRAVAVAVSAGGAVVLVAAVLLARWSLSGPDGVPASATAQEAAVVSETAWRPDVPSQDPRPTPRPEIVVGALNHPETDRTDEAQAATATASGTATTQPADPPDKTNETPKASAEADAEASVEAAAEASAEAAAKASAKPVIRYCSAPAGFDVTAILSGGPNASAIINGKWVRVGGRVSDAKVIRIGASQVVMERDGERFSVGLGESRGTGEPAAPAEAPEAPAEAPQLPAPESADEGDPVEA